MQKNNKLKLFLLSLFFFIISVNFSFALEIKYPLIPGIESPQEFIEKIEQGIYGAEKALPLYINYFYNLSLIIIGLVAFFVIIYGGFRYLTSVGSPAKIADAKDQIMAGILGLIIIFSSYLILVTINPQLITLKLPGLQGIPSPPPSFLIISNPPSIQYQEIPVGTLISSERTYKAPDDAYSDYQGTLHSERLNRIIIISELTKRVTEKLKGLSEELKNLTNQCSCLNSNPNTSSCSYSDPCPATYCVGDPCLNRDTIEFKREQIRLFAESFEFFMKEYLKVEDFIKDNMEDIYDFLPFYYYDLIYEMESVENQYEGFEKNRDDLKKNIDKLKLVKKEIIDCSSFLISYEGRLNLQDDNEVDIEVVKKIESLKDVEVGEDPTTFYCEK